MSSSRTRSSASLSVGDKLAPKFKDCTYDSIKKPEAADLRKWMALLSSIVRNYVYNDVSAGAELEGFLDAVTGRRAKKKATRPAFLDSPEFNWGTHPDEDGISLTSADDRRSANETISEVEDDSGQEPLLGAFPSPNLQASGFLEARSSLQSARKPTTNYDSLSSSAKTLDRVLFNNVLTMVNGEYYDLICDLQGTDARYTVAMYLFHQHAELSVSTRRLKALSKFLDWRYDGNPSKWKMDFLNHTLCCGTLSALGTMSSRTGLVPR